MALIRPANLVIFLTIVAMMPKSLLTQQRGVGSVHISQLWPDISCLPITSDSSIMPYLYQVEWGDFREFKHCLNEYFAPDVEEYCMKTCLVWRLGIISQRKGEVIVNTDVDKLIKERVKSFKWDEESEKIVAKVKEEVTKCRDNHPEMKALQLGEATPCDPKWTPFLSCVDKAFGCPRKDFTILEPADRA